MDNRGYYRGRGRGPHPHGAGNNERRRKRGRSRKYNNPNRAANYNYEYASNPTGYHDNSINTGSFTGQNYNSNRSSNYKYAEFENSENGYHANNKSFTNSSNKRPYQYSENTNDFKRRNIESDDFSVSRTSTAVSSVDENRYKNTNEQMNNDSHKNNEDNGKHDPISFKNFQQGAISRNKFSDEKVSFIGDKLSFKPKKNDTSTQEENGQNSIPVPPKDNVNNLKSKESSADVSSNIDDVNKMPNELSAGENNIIHRKTNLESSLLATPTETDSASCTNLKQETNTSKKEDQDNVESLSNAVVTSHTSTDMEENKEQKNDQNDGQNDHQNKDQNKDQNKGESYANNIGQIHTDAQPGDVTDNQDNEKNNTQNNNSNVDLRCDPNDDKNSGQNRDEKTDKDKTENIKLKISENDVIGKQDTFSFIQSCTGIDSVKTDTAKTIQNLGKLVAANSTLSKFSGLSFKSKNNLDVSKDEDKGKTDAFSFKNHGLTEKFSDRTPINLPKGPSGFYATNKKPEPIKQSEPTSTSISNKSESTGIADTKTQDLSTPFEDTTDLNDIKHEIKVDDISVKNVERKKSNIKIFGLAKTKNHVTFADEPLPKSVTPETGTNTSPITFDKKAGSDNFIAYIPKSKSADISLNHEINIPPSIIDMILPENNGAPVLTLKRDRTILNELSFYSSKAFAKATKTLNIFKFDHSMVSAMTPNSELYTSKTYKNFASPQGTDLNWYKDVLPGIDSRFNRGDTIRPRNGDAEISKMKTAELFSDPRWIDQSESMRYRWSELLLLYVKNATDSLIASNLLYIDRPLLRSKMLADDLRKLSAFGFRFHYVVEGARSKTDSTHALLSLLDEIFNHRHDWCKSVKNINFFDHQFSIDLTSQKKFNPKSSLINFSLISTPKLTSFFKNPSLEVNLVLEANTFSNKNNIINVSTLGSSFRLNYNSMSLLANYLVSKNMYPDKDNSLDYVYNCMDVFITHGSASTKIVQELDRNAPYSGGVLRYGKIDKTVYAVQFLINTENEKWDYDRPTMIIARHKSLPYVTQGLFETIDWIESDSSIELKFRFLAVRKLKITPPT
jgi:hypothetical protein